MKKVYGIDLTEANIRIGVFNEDGSMVRLFEKATRLRDKGRYILTDIADAVKRTNGELSLKSEDICGIGIGVPAPVDEDGKVLGCPCLGWGIVDVKTILSQLTGYSVAVANDANCAAMGEFWLGAARGYENVVMVTLGTGVGGGIIGSGKIVTGSNGAGGEIGHITVNSSETEVCSCGKKGCLAQYSSASGMVRLAKAYRQDCPESILFENETLKAEDIFDGAGNEDALSLMLLDQISGYLGMALANVACVCDPQVFVLGGDVSGKGGLFLEKIRDHYRNSAFHATKYAVFSMAELGSDACIYGGAKLALG